MELGWVIVGFHPKCSVRWSKERRSCFTLVCNNYWTFKSIHFQRAFERWIKKSQGKKIFWLWKRPTNEKWKSASENSSSYANFFTAQWWACCLWLLGNMAHTMRTSVRKRDEESANTIVLEGGLLSKPLVRTATWWWIINLFLIPVFIGLSSLWFLHSLYLTISVGNANYMHERCKEHAKNHFLTNLRQQSLKTFHGNIRASNWMILDLKCEQDIHY